MATARARRWFETATPMPPWINRGSVRSAIWVRVAFPIVLLQCWPDCLPAWKQSCPHRQRRVTYPAGPNVTSGRSAVSEQPAPQRRCRQLVLKTWCCEGNESVSAMGQVHSVEVDATVFGGNPVDVCTGSCHASTVRKRGDDARELAAACS